MLSKQFKTRAEDLRASLEQTILALQTRPEAVDWEATLNQFAVLNVQYHALMQELSPVLKHCVVYPKAVNEENHNILPVMMSTRLLPEMEAESQELLQNSQFLKGDKSVFEQYEALEAEIDKFNKLIDHLTVPKQNVENSGLLSAKSSLRTEISQPVSKSSNAAMSKFTADTTSAGPKRAAGGKQLQGADLLLAAATRGQGLR